MADFVPGTAMIPPQILRNGALSPQARLLWALLDSYANADRECWPSQETLAKDYGASDRSVRKVIVQLEDAGLVQVVPGGFGKSSRYRLLSPQCGTKVPEAKFRNESSGSKVPPNPEQKFRSDRNQSSGSGGTKVPTNTIMEHNQRTQSENTSAAPTPPDTLTSAPPTATQGSFELKSEDPKATPKWAKATQVAALWNEAMPLQVHCKPDKMNSGVLAAAFDSHGLDGLRDLFQWAQTDDWMCGRKGNPKQAQAWLSKGGLATAEQKRKNAATAPQQVAPNDYKTIERQRDRTNDD